MTHVVKALIPLFCSLITVDLHRAVLLKILWGLVEDLLSCALNTGYRKKARGVQVDKRKPSLLSFTTAFFGFGRQLSIKFPGRKLTKTCTTSRSLYPLTPSRHTQSLIP